jgi:DNA-binding NtrC family response regulator
VNQHYKPPSSRVLWVDDRPEGNSPYVADLERRGVHVSIARTTSLALVLLARNKYLAVISDMGRREGPREGFHLLDAMRARGDATPFYIFASLSAPALSDEASLHDAQECTNDFRKVLLAIEQLAGIARVQNSGA